MTPARPPVRPLSQLRSGKMRVFAGAEGSVNGRLHGCPGIRVLHALVGRPGLGTALLRPRKKMRCDRDAAVPQCRTRLRRRTGRNRRAAPLDAEPGGGHTGVGLLQICLEIVRGGVGGRNDLRRCICAQDGRFRRSASGVVASNWSQRRSAASRPDVSASPTETPCR